MCLHTIKVSVILVSFFFLYNPFENILLLDIQQSQIFFFSNQSFEFLSYQLLARLYHIALSFQFTSTFWAKTLFSLTFLYLFGLHLIQYL